MEHSATQGIQPYVARCNSRAPDWVGVQLSSYTRLPCRRGDDSDDAAAESPRRRFPDLSVDVGSSRAGFRRCGARLRRRAGSAAAAVYRRPFGIHMAYKFARGSATCLAKHAAPTSRRPTSKPPPSAAGQEMSKQEVAHPDEDGRASIHSMPTASQRDTPTLRAQGRPIRCTTSSFRQSVSVHDYATASMPHLSASTYSHQHAAAALQERSGPPAAARHQATVSEQEPRTHHCR
jgi:hypothetical protein